MNGNWNPEYIQTKVAKEFNTQLEKHIGYRLIKEKHVCTNTYI